MASNKFTWGGGLQLVCGRPTLAFSSALVPQTLRCSVQLKLKRREAPKYKPNVQVHFSKYKMEFGKGYTQNWTEEIFVIDEVDMTNLVTCSLRDLRNEVLSSFYQRELANGKQKILRIRQLLRISRHRSCWCQCYFKYRKTQRKIIWILIFQ